MRLTYGLSCRYALIRGRATGNGSEIALACDISFASRKKRLYRSGGGRGLVAGGGPMARLPRLMGRNRALEVLLSSNDIGGDLAEAYGYVNRSLRTRTSTGSSMRSRPASRRSTSGRSRTRSAL